MAELSGLTAVLDATQLSPYGTQVVKQTAELTPYFEELLGSFYRDLNLANDLGLDTTGVKRQIAVTQERYNKHLKEHDLLLVQAQRDYAIYAQAQLDYNNV